MQWSLLVLCEVWFGGCDSGVHNTAHSSAGPGGEPSFSFQRPLCSEWQLLTLQPAGRHFARAGEKEKKIGALNVRDSEGRKEGKKGSKTCVQELNQWLEHSHLTTGSHTVKQCFRQQEEVAWSRQHRLSICRGSRLVLDHWRSSGTAMEQRFRNYSSDSMGSDRVFVEESYYQGRLKATDHRKGRVCHHLDAVSLVLALRCFLQLN